MLYLVNCTVHRQRYMGESSEYEKNHIVDASSEEEAQKKLKQYYSRQDDSYYATYYIDINYCNEVIT